MNYLLIASLVSMVFVCQGTDYEFLLDKDIFYECPDNNLGVLDIADMTNMTMSANGAKLHVEGSMTLNWDSKATRYELTATLHRFSNGVWESPVITVKEQDFCPVMYTKGKYWYTYFLSYVLDEEKAKEQCLNYGTVLAFKPHDQDCVFPNVYGMNLSGRYKIKIVIVPYEGKNILQELCMEIRGEFVKRK
ncbi:uncharacterized protein LOC111518360 [Drosophila willistoni]|uniref:uncharacterized protein LOC111518360 n=1 Tax=Drosophila willistoni TaxID=7260 RepID=UPI001F0743D3|nr:uncharacterized protein LOC111518360 [Drosophila willistoni]